MKASKKLIEQIKIFEGLRTEAYLCPAGIWTIGYGHTQGVEQGMTVSQAKAEQLLKEDLRSFEDYVDYLRVCKTQGQFDALVDFAFNLGNGRLASSTLLKHIRAGSSENAIRGQFMRWINSGGKPLEGLRKRRKWEADRFFE